jgi:energy-coupling factor transporter ATP-binding protein EcfA2
MKLAKAQVTNFRSIEDSGPFDVDDMLCLVGKNEAGKSALLQAIAGIHPHPLAPITFDKERDYPRRFLTAYSERHSDGKDAVVATTWWSLDGKERAKIAEVIGPEALTNELVQVLRRYSAAAPEWLLPVDHEKAVSFLIAEERLDDEEQKTLGRRTSDALRQSLEAIAQRTSRQDALLQRLNAMPGKNVIGLVRSILDPGLPHFLYFSHYDRMAGAMRVDDVTGEGAARVHTQQLNAQNQRVPTPLSVGEQIFLDFLEFAGASIEDIRRSNTYESLNAKCEAASNAITDQLRDYWTQNPHLDIEIRITKFEPNDPQPLNEGVIARARVKNNVHRVTVPFSERSAGFIWFFSFLVKFAQVRKLGGNIALLLDEPGLTLHGKAQADLLRYFADKIVPKHQLIYSTHSPFMVPPDDLMKSRIVEDQIFQSRLGGPWMTKGTKVRDDILAIDPDTLFPLQAALGYDVTQTLFMGRNTLLVEGPGDILYLKALSEQLRRRGRPSLDRRWTICPAGGIDKIQSFVSLFSGANLEIAVMTDYSVSDKRKLDALRRSQILKAGRVMTFAETLGLPEADVEDIFDPDVYLTLVNSAYEISAADALTTAKLDAAAPGTSRLVKRVEAAHRLLPPAVAEFDHFTPADWLVRNPSVLDGDAPTVEATLVRAEAVIRAINEKLATH